ncbi:STAS domain-containing protein [Niallia sp. 03133]|uniref:STAS domain-containing protein n=1 Tax=Niallia sp. 03133 TaxID=3458060 RepID=UPI0040449C84
MAECMKELYTYLMNHAEDMCNDWLQTIENSTSTFYSTNNSEETLKLLIDSHQTLVENVMNVFLEEESVYEATLTNWAVSVAKKRSNDAVPIVESIQQLNQTKSIFISYIEKFADKDPQKLSVQAVFKWIGLTNFAFDLFTNIFIEYYDKFKLEQLYAQQETIHELSCPVIPIARGIGVLPLIGDIDTKRAHIIMEATLAQCSEKHIENLFIDLSGVVIIDTMVAHQLFQVMQALKLIGVHTYLSGLRPEIAQTAIQLGIDFSKISIFNNLASALTKLGFQVEQTNFA